MTQGKRERAADDVMDVITQRLMDPDDPVMSIRDQDRMFMAQALCLHRQAVAAEMAAVALLDINRKLGDLVRAVEDIH